MIRGLLFRLSTLNLFALFLVIISVGRCSITTSKVHVLDRYQVCILINNSLVRLKLVVLIVDGFDE